MVNKLIIQILLYHVVIKWKNNPIRQHFLRNPNSKIAVAGAIFLT